MVAGPFDTPPLENFRVNPLMAVKQKNKVRPILNLSAPKNASFNDAVVLSSLRKLEMSSAALFAKALRKAGKGALMAKYDICDAYKQVAGVASQWAAFGFHWLGKYFFDITTVFGSKSAPANFDSIPETVVNIVCALTKVPKGIVHRQLDDVPIVSPASTSFAQVFAAKYVEVCGKVGLPLAADCPLREKSFGVGTNGTVLGIDFDSENLTWKLPNAKADGITNVVNSFLAVRTCSLKDVQRLHGKLSDFSQMAEFMKGFRFQLSKLLGSFENCERTRKLIPKFLVEDLHIWKKCVLTAKNGLPIGFPPLAPPPDSREIHVRRRWSRSELEQWGLHESHEARGPRGRVRGVQKRKSHMLRRHEMVMGPHDKAERFKRSLVGLQEQRSRMYWPVASFRDKSQKPEKQVCSPICRQYQPNICLGKEVLQK